ncbi:MAG TPA: glycosyltransferase [Solirubrobacteraceae bacterium]|nr:glycosyltransferase [Solirubrobacteraceae bacterium]
MIDAYRIVKATRDDVQLALLGSMATDDPEGWDYFNATIAHADGDPDIHIFNVVIQKSIREGFGLTVTESLWKARPTIGGDVGGIPLQITDGESGFLVSNVEECARRSIEILADPSLRKQLGRHGKEAARARFLTPRLLRGWLSLFTELAIA